ncbi:hypothetical protein E0287_04895 [Campylobacter coli]|nr:hypothetical protein [Campylobacter coli]
MIFADLKEAFTKNKIWAGVLSSIFGFFSDVCQPLAPFSKYLFFISLIFFIIALLAYLLKMAKVRILPILVFSLLSTFISGIMYGLQNKEDDQNKGFLAGVIPAIAKLQESLGIVEKNLEEIRVISQDINKTTADIKKDTSDIKSKLDDVISVAFKQGGIIANPQTAEEFYHNAWIFENNGDYANARKAYIKYFSFNTEKLDPHLQFQKFLKIQDGLAGAKEIYDEMFDSSNFVNVYAKILLETKDRKLKQLKDFSEEKPDFAPVFYELARLYSPKSIANQTLSDKKSEKEYIDKFLELNQKGRLAKYFIDKDLLNEWINYANERKIQLDKIDLSVFDNPVTMSRICFFIESSQAKCQVDLNIIDKAREIWYKTDKDNNFISTGKINYRWEDGIQMPNYSLEISAAKGHKDIEYIDIKYMDLNKDIKGPFRLEWNKKLANGIIINGMMMAQIEFANSNPDLLGKVEVRDFMGCVVYFTGLQIVGSAVEKVLYSINTNKLDKEKIPTYMDDKRMNIDTQVKVESYKNNTKIYFKYFFKDGSESKVFENILIDACEGKNDFRNS